VGDPEVQLHPAAVDEYAEAYARYASQSEAVAERFEREVVAGLALIGEDPGRWPSFDVKHRKLLLRRFPYLLIYREIRGRIWVVAVAHGHRRPGYWRGRQVEP